MDEIYVKMPENYGYGKLQKDTMYSVENILEYLDDVLTELEHTKDEFSDYVKMVDDNFKQITREEQIGD